MSNTPITGLRYLRENDVSNSTSINYNLSRLDVLSTLVLESTTTTQQPEGPADGKAWGVSPGATGSVWGTIEEDSILIYADDGTGTLVWQAIPAWTGAYGYVIDDAQFQSYDGDSWARPSKRKVVNITIDSNTLSRFSGSGASIGDWLPLLRVDSTHLVVEAHYVVRFKSSLYASVPAEQFVDQSADVPFLKPKLAVTTGRSSAPTAGDIFVQDASTSVASGKWNIPRDVFTGTPPSPYAKLDYASASTGLITKFDAGYSLDVASGAESNGAVYANLGGTFPAATNQPPLNSETLPNMTGFAWINLKGEGTHTIFESTQTNYGFSFKVVEAPNNPGVYVLAFIYGRGSRENEAYVTGGTPGIFNNTAAYVAPAANAPGRFGADQVDQWYHVGFSFDQNSSVSLYLNGQSLPVHHDVTTGGSGAIDMEWLRNSLKLGSGEGGGLLIDELKLYFDDASEAYDYNDGSGTPIPEVGKEDSMIFRLTADENTGINQGLVPTPWWANTPSFTNATSGATVGVVPTGGATTAYPQIAVTTPGEGGYVLANFNDVVAGTPLSSTGLADIEDVTIQIVYTGFSQ